MAIVSSKTPDPGVPEPKTVASPTPMAKESSVADVGPADAPPPPKNSAKSESLLTPNVSSEDLPSQSEERIRPQRLEEYIGQRELKAVLEIAIQAAKSRKDPLDHLLLYGPPGLGKTTISLILATEMGVNCRVTSAPALERPRDIVGLLMTLQAGDILFIDEIHRLSRMSEELLYPAMEDFRLDITIGKGQTARIRSLDLQPFTLVGATTRVGALSSPLRDRFGFVQRLRFYEAEELAQIVQRTAGVLELAIAPEAALEIARRSRGTPRIANRLLKRVRDFAQVKTPQPQGDPPATSTGKPPIGLSAAQAALELFNVDPCGLDWTDRRMLTVMIEQFQGGPVGLETLAASTGEDAQTIEEVYEPYLLQIGYLSRTPRGRVATAAAWTHLGYSPPSGSTQLSLS